MTGLFIHHSENQHSILLSSFTSPSFYKYLNRHHSQNIQEVDLPCVYVLFFLNNPYSERLYFLLKTYPKYHIQVYGVLRLL